MTENKFPITLQTFLCATNVLISAQKRAVLFDRLQDYVVQEEDIPYKKKKKEPCTKEVNVPVGRIFGLSCGDRSWGIVKNKKMNHIDCNSEEDKILQSILSGESDSKNNFKNALCVYMSMPKNNVHIMRFSGDVLKIAGCKDVDECILATSLLWKHIEPHKDCYKIMHTEGDSPNLIKHSFYSSMINLNFSAKYIIDREKLLDLLNNQYKDKIKDARWQDTQNNILVRFDQEKNTQYFKTTFFQRGHMDNMIVAEIPPEEFQEIRELIYAYKSKVTRKTLKKVKPIRVKINRTSTVMATGTYLEELNDYCELVMNILKNNEENVKEKLKPITEIDEDYDISNFVVSNKSE